MKILIIGRTEILFKTVQLLIKKNFEIPLIITSKEAPEYTKKSKDFRKLAKKMNAKFLYTNDIKKIIKEIKITKCHIGVSINYNTIISQEVIDLLPLGILNAHGGDLPRYRGNACQAWAILNGEDKIGLCIHSMIGGEIDSGKIIDRKYLKINENTKVTEIWNWMKLKIPMMFLNSIKKLKKNPNYFLDKQSKKNKDILRCYPRFPYDGKINWNKSNLEILRLINASNKPYKGAYTFFKNRKLIIWDAEVYDDKEKYLAEAGQVASIEKNGSIIIITGKGKLKINVIEHKGLKNKPAKIIRSIRNRLI